MIAEPGRRDPEGRSPAPQRSGRRRRTTAAVVSALSVVCGVAAFSAQAPAPVQPGAPVTATAPARLRVLQANLCDSGEAPCYTGRSVARLGEVIRAERPDVVTVNEICEDDVAAIRGVLDGLAGDDVVLSAFRAAGDRRTHADYRCVRNGRRYGNAVLARTSSAGLRHTTRDGLYQVQDLTGPEERAWACLDVTDRFTACTTHLANGVPTVTIRQCRALMATVFPPGAQGRGRPTTLVGGDLNLFSGRPPDVRPCWPPGTTAAGDTGVQYVVSDGTVESSRSIGMLSTTDHPALLAVLAP